MLADAVLVLTSRALRISCILLTSSLVPKAPVIPESIDGATLIEKRALD